MIPTLLLKRLWLECILLMPFSAIAQISGITITPAGATAVGYFGGSGVNRK